MKSYSCLVSRSQSMLESCVSDSIEQQSSSLDRLNRWFRLATLAPSGANLQPWSYSGQQIGNGFKITLRLGREYLKSPSSIDPFFFAAAISLGAFARNLEIAALLDGFYCANTDTAVGGLLNGVGLLSFIHLTDW